MRHSPDFHRQIRALEALGGRPRRRWGFPAAVVAAVMLGGAIGIGWAGRPAGAAPEAAGPLFETVDPWAESRKSATLLARQEGAPPAARPRFASAGAGAASGGG